MKIDATLFAPDVLQTLQETPQIFQTIAEFQGRELSLQKQLRAAYPDHIVRAALIIHDLRHRAGPRFSRAERMWFDRTGLEQSTSELVAAWKARRFSGEVVDICSGIGGDSLALAQVASVISIDRVHARGMCLAWNAEVYEVADRIEVRTATAEVSDAAGRLVHIDPDRRAGVRGRSLRIEDLQPSPEFLRELRLRARGGAIKLSPASNFRGAFDDCEVELVSAHGECKEATAWFGELRGEDSVRATVAATGETLSGDLSWDMAPVAAPRRFVLDPDPALVRSGLLDRFCLDNNVQRLDAEEEYLTCDDVPESGFVSGKFEVTAILPHETRTIRRYLREHGVGRVEIKARRIPTDVEKLRRDLKLRGADAATLLVARVDGHAKILVANRLSP